MVRQVVICFALAAILAITGCTGGKHLSRLGGPTERLRYILIPPEERPSALTSGFDGHLNLLYEKKIKGSADSPIMVGRKYLTFLTTRRRVAVIDQETGHRVCQIRSRRGYAFAPAIVDSFLVTVRYSPFGQTQVINLFTGKVAYESTIKEIRTGPIQVMNRLIFGTTSGLIALSLDLNRLWNHETDGTVESPIIADGGIVFAIVKGNRLQAIRGEDGNLIWEFTSSTTISSEIGLGRYLYVGTADGRVLAVDKALGKMVWERPLGWPYRGAACEADDKVYLGCNDGKVYCLSAVDGTPIWDYQTGGVVTASPIVVGRAVIVGSNDKYLYSLDRVDGAMLDKRRLEGPIRTAAVHSNGCIFAACRQGRIYCFEGK